MIPNGDDGKYVDELRLGSESAFNFLYSKYALKIYSTARKMSLNHEDAEGVVQETFIKIWKNRERLDSSLSFNAYLLSILKSIVVRLTQRNARQKLQTNEWASNSVLAINQTEDDLFFAEMMEASLQELNKLPPRQREVFILKRVESFSLDEIASKLHISKKTVKNQLVEANKFLKTRIKDREIIALLIFFNLMN